MTSTADPAKADPQPARRRTATRKTAILYREKTAHHLCPWGLRSRHLLHAQGYHVEDHLLTSRDQIDAFKDKHEVETTPQAFIGGERIGGYEELLAHFDKPVPDDDAETYTPVVAVFAAAAVMAFAFAWAFAGSFPDNQLTLKFVQWFVALSMAMLAVQKLRDLDGFATRFLGYDLLARAWVPYAWIYPFAELGAGAGMITETFRLPAALVSLFIGTVGAVSVIQAVWIEKRELKCACVGGSGNVPLGPVSLTENLMMAGMGLWMLFL